MECLTEVKEKVSIEAGDILIYSKNIGFLIIETDTEFIAIQNFNNSNERLGISRYYGISANKVVEDIIRAYGDYSKIINIKDMQVSF